MHLKLQHEGLDDDLISCLFWLMNVKCLYVEDLVEEYITRGASAVVLSDAIFCKEAIARGDFDTISEQAQLAASIGIEAKKQL